MKYAIKTLTLGTIFSFIYYVAFVKDVFFFECLAWFGVVLSFLGLCSLNIMKKVASEVNFLTYLFSLPFVAFYLWIFFFNGAEVFGYVYLFCTLIGQAAILFYKLEIA